MVEINMDEDQDSLNSLEFKKLDTRVAFGGRTMMVKCMFTMDHDPETIGNLVRDAVSGPRLLMSVGVIARRKNGFTTVSFVNTDEPTAELYDRVNAIAPRPLTLYVEEMSAVDATEVWTTLHRMQDGGD